MIIPVILITVSLDDLLIKCYAEINIGHSRDLKELRMRRTERLNFCMQALFAMANPYLGKLMK